MIIQILEGPPHLDHWPTPRDQQMFEYCAISGRVWQGLVDGKLVACWGAIPPSFLSDNAYVWMLDLPITHPLIFLRHSRRVIDQMLDQWDLLRGHCHIEAHHSQKFMSWLGGFFGEPHKGLVPFEIRRR